MPSAAVTRRKLRQPGLGPDRPLSLPDVTQQLHVIQRALEKVARDMDADRDIVDSVAFVVQELLQQLEPDASRRHRTSPTRPLQEDHALRMQAAAGASRLDIDPQPDGAARVRIDGREWFRLPPKLWMLLAIISGPTITPSADGLIGWRTYDAVAGLLAKRTGKPQGADALTKQITKLRAAVRKARENEYLIETDRHRAVRFRIQKRSQEASPQA